MVLQEHVPLAPLTTFRIGGPAQFFVEARTSTEVAEAVIFATSRDLPLFVLGGGSNLVVADAGWPGLVLKVSIPGIERGPDRDGKAMFEVGAGEPWDRFVSQAVAAHCAGIECLSGIPGSTGGTPVQNVGAYGQEVSDTVVSVRAYDRNNDRTVELSHDDCRFTYFFNDTTTTERERFII